MAEAKSGDPDVEVEDFTRDGDDQEKKGATVDP